MECTRWHKNHQAYLEVIKKENKTDDVICLHFGVYGNICRHMIPSSGIVCSQVKTRKDNDGNFVMAISQDSLTERSLSNGI